MNIYLHYYNRLVYLIIEADGVTIERCVKAFDEPVSETLIQQLTDVVTELIGYHVGEEVDFVPLLETILGRVDKKEAIEICKNYLNDQKTGE